LLRKLDPGPTRRRRGARFHNRASSDGVTAVAPVSSSQADEWDELAERAGAESIWLRPGWILAWWGAFGRGRFELATLRRGDRLAALVPLARTAGACRSPTNYHTPSFGVLAEDDSAAGELIEELFASRPRRVELAFFMHGSSDVRDFHGAAERAGYYVLERTLERGPYVETDGSWDAYEPTIAGKVRREVRRRRRRLQAEGTLVTAVEEGTERLDELLQEGFRVEAAAWKGKNGTAIASRAETEGFYREVAHWAAARGWLRLAFLRLDGRPLAFDFAIEYAGHHYLLKTGYDPAYRSLAPAMVLRHEMIQRAFRVGLRSYEFGGSDESWKLEWTRKTNDRVLVQAFARTVVGAGEWAACAYARPVAKRLRALTSR
jgi:CelD/BcsL family acetyltransferase involved in cellulose biosynthesis